MFGPGAAAQAPQPPVSPPARLFSIGYLTEGGDLPQPTVTLERLRRFLLDRPAVVQALARAGFDDIILSPCDGPRDMVQRLSVGEFELAFATAVVWARQLDAPYQPVLQTRLPGDIAPPGGGVMRRGVIIAGVASPLFSAPAGEELAPEQLIAELSRQPIAVTWADSAAGYIYPRLILQREFGIAQPTFWFCGSDEEVMKHVVAGIAPYGACRAGELQALPGTTPPLVRTLLETPPFPTDAILFHEQILPARTDLGRELKAALREFFNLTRDHPGELRVEDASGEAYAVLARRLTELQAPGTEPTPTPTPRPAPVLPPLDDEAVEAAP